MNRRNPQARATIEQKAEWLMDHPELWQMIPDGAPYVTHRSEYLAIARAWKDEGLIAPSTAWIDAGMKAAINLLYRRLASKQTRSRRQRLNMYFPNFRKL